MTTFTHPCHLQTLRRVYKAWCETENMTLCIGALAHQPSPLEKCIVLCFDYKVSNDAWGSESEYKFHILSEQLVAMVAGSPATAKELALMYQEHLPSIRLSRASAVDELRKPLADLKFRKADSYIRNRLAVSYREFLEHGGEWFGAPRVDRCLRAIEEHQPNIEMIIAGFLEGSPVLYQIAKNRSTLELAEVTNFCMIGSGSYTAEPALHSRGQIFTTPLFQAVYNLYEAKKVGERSPYVGQKTRMFVLRPPDDGTRQIRAEVVTDAGEKALQKLLKRYGPKPMKVWPDLPRDSLERAHFRWP